MITFT